jgi:hypothetical protein
MINEKEREKTINRINGFSYVLKLMENINFKARKKH